MSNDTTGPVGPARLVGRGRRVLLSVLAGVLLVVSGGASLATVTARAATSHAAAAGGILVAANDSDPASTGVYLTPGQEFSVTATGTGQYGIDQCGSEGVVQITTDPDGNRFGPDQASCGGTKIDPAAIDGNAPVGSLIGRIGDTGQWFEVGSNFSGQAGFEGPLYLLYNDDLWSDNSPQGFTASVTVSATVPANVGTPGVDTGIFLPPGSSFTIAASGSGGYGGEGQTDCSGLPSTDPDGNRTIDGVACTPSQKLPDVNGDFPDNGAPVGALLWQASTEATWHLAGSSSTNTSTGGGELFLLYNDDDPSNNTGAYSVLISLGQPGSTGGSGGSTSGVPAAPTETSAAVDGTDSTGAHSLIIHGTGLDSVTQIIYGAVSSITTLPPPCPIVLGALAATRSTCLYTVTAEDHGSGGSTELAPQSPPQADLSHITLVSPYGRSAVFAASNVPVEPHLNWAAVLSYQQTKNGQTEPTEVELNGSGLSTAVDVTYGTIDLPNPTLDCPVEAVGGGLAPAGGTCSYSVTASDHNFHPNGTADTDLVVPVPPGADLAHLTVFSPGGWSNMISAYQLPAQPKVTSADAVFNGDGSGTLSVFGSGLSGVTRALLGQPFTGEMPNECPFDPSGPTAIQQNIPCVEPIMVSGVDTDKELLFYFPPGATGSNNQGGNLSHIVLLSSGGPSSAFAAEVPARPSINSIIPAGTAADGRPLVVITGTNLDGATSVDFGNIAAIGVRNLSPAQVEVEVPRGTGSVAVTVDTLGGGSNPLMLSFPAIGTVALLSQAPTSSALPNGWISIAGTGLIPADGSTPRVFFAATPSPDVVVQNGTLYAQVPNLPAGSPTSVYVVVRTPNGDSPNTGACQTGTPTGGDCFAYPQPGQAGTWLGEFPLTVSSISPTHGPAAGGTAVTINGAGLAGAHEVDFGPTKLTTTPCAAGTTTGCFNVTSDFQLTVYAPAGLAGESQAISVVTPGGTVHGPSYTYDSSPGTGGSAPPPAPSAPAQLPLNLHTSGAWTNAGNGVFTYTGAAGSGPVGLNGLDLTADTGVTITLNIPKGTLSATGNITVSLGAVTVPVINRTVGPFVIYKGTPSWNLAFPQIPIQIPSLSQLIPNTLTGLLRANASVNLAPISSIAGFPVAGSAGLTFSGSGATLAVSPQLPSFLGGTSAAAYFQTDANGIVLNSLNVTIPQVGIGGVFQAQNVHLAYDGSAWAVSGTITGPGHTVITGNFSYDAGQLTSAAVNANSLYLAKLVQLNGFALNYAASPAGEEDWSGHLDGASGQSLGSFTLTFQNGTLTDGHLSVPTISIGGLADVTNFGIDYTNNAGKRQWSGQAQAQIPGVGASGSVKFLLALDPSGNITDAELHGNAALPGGIQVNQLDVIYNPGGDQYGGSIVVTLPGGLSVGGGATFKNGQLTEADLTVNGKIQMAPLVYLTQGTLKVTTSPLTITGGVSIEGGPPLSLPGLGSVTAIKGTGQFTFSTANGWDLDVNGNLALAGMSMNQGGAQADIDVSSAKGVTFSGSINVNNAAVKFTAALNGDISGNGFYVGANVNITLPWLNNFTAGAAVGIGSGGIGACVNIGPFSGGGAFHWNGQIDKSFGGCDLSKFNLGPHILVNQSVTGVGARRPLAVVNAHDSQPANSFTLPDGLKGALFQVVGQGSVPVVNLVDPSGNSLSIPANVTSGTVIGNEVEALVDSGDDTLFLAVGSFNGSAFSSGGTWSITNNGGAPITSASVAQVLPAAQVSATVAPSGTGAGQTLSWSLLPEVGQDVQFVETGDGVTAQVITDTNDATGSFSFEPADGPGGLRQITAIVNQGGDPRATFPVAQYVASSPTTPDVPQSVSAGAGPGLALVSWQAPDYDGGDPIQGYVVTGSDGSVATTGAAQRSLAMPLSSTALTYTVAAYNQNGAGTASAASAPVSSTLPPAGPSPAGSTTPWAPSGLTGAPGDGQVSLNWSAPAQDGGSPLTGYVVVTEPGDQIKSLPAGSTGLAVSGLTNGSNYSFQVLALNANGASPAAVTAQLTPNVQLSVPVLGGPPTGGSLPSGPPTLTHPVLASLAGVAAGSPGTTMVELPNPAVPSGFIGLPTGLQITTPPGTIQNPLSLTLQVFTGALPNGQPVTGLTVFRDLTPVLFCTGSGDAPDPCLVSETVAGSTVTLVVRTQHASTWSLGVPDVLRTAGADRIATSVAASEAVFPVSGSAPAAVLARSDQFADGLAGTPLARSVGGPLLLSDSTGLSPAAASELSRVLKPGAPVYLLGGTGALSTGVEQAVTARGFHVQRLAGTDRYATAAAVAKQVGSPKAVFLTTGTDFPDALAAGVAAAQAQGVVLLTTGTAMAPATASYLSGFPGPVYAVGGPAAAADKAATPVVGADRYATAAAVAAKFFPSATAAAVASGTGFADSLAAGASLPASEPILLTDPAALSPAVSGYLVSAHTAAVHVFGGTAAVSDAVVNQLRAAVSGGAAAHSGRRR